MVHHGSAPHRGQFMPGEKGARVGDWVEVRPLGEIVSTLDKSGALDGLPFMPEMVPFVGLRFRIVKSAHKTCDPTGATDLRRIPNTVHLSARCNGSAHGGCEARCLLFWKRDWLMPVNGPGASGGPPPTANSTDREALHTTTRKTGVANEVRYRCQATEIVSASTALPVSDLRQYLEDVSSRNVSPARFVAEMASAWIKAVLGRANKLLHRGREQATTAKPVAAPGIGANRLDLGVGEYVQVRPAAEILATLDGKQKNLGLSLEPEMLRHCGNVYRVLARITRIIDERSGKMIKLANDCIALEGVICTGLDNRRRIFCPRGPLFYWREAWLKRVDDPIKGKVS